MSITEKGSAFVDPNAGSIDLSQMFTVTAGSSDPAYLVLTVLDRDEYTAAATGATGSLSGNGQTLDLTSSGGDARSAGIVFTYQPSTGRYYNSTYGYMDQLIYNPSASAGDVTNLSVFGTSMLGIADAFASNPYGMAEVDSAGYIGSATVVTQPKFTAAVPAQATPDSIAAAADSFIGQAWNSEGCWILASTVAADAGASLPMQSTLIGLPGVSNGEWIVAFNGPAGQTGNWQSLVTAGEMVVFQTASGGGHITTCVSGTGSSAMLVDNIVYTNSSGQILNPANDGSSSDILISAPHAASLEWNNVSASSVVIYELDTPVVTCNEASLNLATLASALLAPLFSVADPGNLAITEWQVYDTAGTDALVLSGVDYQDHSASAALTVASLSAMALLAGSAVTTDTLDVRAYNGGYWGDWASLGVAIVPGAPPVLEARTGAQTWLGGKPVTLALPAGTFHDPQNETLTYSAKLTSGAALPAWLSFNAATETFTGTASATAQSLSIVVTATDVSGLSATDQFTATVVGTPVLVTATGSQTWTEGDAVSLAIPTGTFTDPQGQSLSYTATQSNGQALPGWLTFNAATQTFSGTAPTTAQNLGITVTATDTSGLSASESFTAGVQPPPPPIVPGIAITAQTPNQIWTDGQAASLVLPSDTFTDALGLQMTFSAFELSGPNTTSWLRFNAATDDLLGNVPAAASGSMQIAIVAIDPQFMIAVDVFGVTFASPPGSGASSIRMTSPATAGAFDPAATPSLPGADAFGSRAVMHQVTGAEAAGSHFSA